MDRSNKEMMNSLCTAFDISPEDFWNSAQRLHELELVDMYENEIVKISDQVLATYLFYLAYFKERALTFRYSCLFLSSYRHRLIDAINPILNIFNAEAVINEMRPHVDKFWKSLKDPIEKTTFSISFMCSGFLMKLVHFYMSRIK